MEYNKLSVKTVQFARRETTPPICNCLARERAPKLNGAAGLFFATSSFIWINGAYSLHLLACVVSLPSRALKIAATAAVNA